MQMTKQEICQSYREAKNKKAQIGILADLNVVTTDYIKEILNEGGELNRKPKTEVKKKAAVINEDFAAAVDEMTGKRAPLPGVIKEAVCYAVEAMDEQIEKYEQEQEALCKKIAELNEKRRSIMEYIERPIYE